MLLSHLGEPQGSSVNIFLIAIREALDLTLTKVLPFWT